MDFIFGINLKGSLKTVLRHLQKELCDIMAGKGTELQLQDDYKFQSPRINPETVSNAGHNPAGSEVVQLLMYLQFSGGDNSADAGVIGYSQCRWDVPTKPATNEDWRRIWIPMFRRSSKEEPIPSKLLNRKVTCGSGIQHLRMYPSGIDTAYVFLLHDWEGKMLWIPLNDRTESA